MKKTLLIVSLCFLSLGSFAQYAINSLSLSFGGGLATTSNYNVGLTGGLQYIHGLSDRYGIGFNIMYQGYDLYYKNESSAGNAGMDILHKSGYVFLSPKIEYLPGRTGKLRFYLSPGVGFNMSGTETTHKFNNSFGTYGLGNYDSTLTTTSNINKLVFRIQFGLTEHIWAGSHYFITFTEDVQFLATDLSKSGSLSDGSRTVYSPHSTKPGYISLLIGLDHRKRSKHANRGLLD